MADSFVQDADRARAWIEQRMNGRGKLYAGQPYMYHLDLVAGKLWSDFHRTVAYLHDSVEDGQATLLEIQAEFGDEVALVVEALTRRFGEGYFEDYLPRLMKTPAAIPVKLADARVNYDHSIGESLNARYGRAIAILRKWVEENSNYLF